MAWVIVLLVGSFLFMIFLFSTASWGWEDEEGYHEGKKDA